MENFIWSEQTTVASGYIPYKTSQVSWYEVSYLYLPVTTILVVPYITCLYGYLVAVKNYYYGFHTVHVWYILYVQ